ncbi:Z1 domain-containing protein (plasmid) [Coraliomargarita sp. W4R53]
MALTEDQRSLEAQLTMWVVNENRKRRASVPLDELETKARQLSEILTPDLDDLEIDQVVVVVTTKGNVTQGIDVGIVDRAFNPWIAERKPATDEKRWNAYRGLLVSRGWAPQVIDALERQTDAVVELMGDPAADAPWARRGLLMGEVQSGKTATYIGVLNKAIDYGYRVIIILGGHTNDLRGQTQERVDVDLTGTNSSFLEDNITAVGAQMRTGIGLVDQTFRTIGMTTVRRDFSASSKLASTVWVDTGVPTVFVIKKNVRMLENVKTYIDQQAGPNGFDLPLVVVDDEADWGSPNTADPDRDPTRVNKGIRNLLDVSSRSTYLGITATPFANVLIDHTIDDDLFPSNYIRALAAPSNYLGVGTYFDAGSDAVSTDVEDCLRLLPLKHKKEHPFGDLPSSLEDAVITFLIGCAIRLLREGEAKPASMMVNISRFNLVQSRVHDALFEFTASVSGVITTEFARAENAGRSQLAARVRQLADYLYPQVMASEFSWPQVAESLTRIAETFRIDLVNNQTSKERVNARRQMTPEQRDAHDARPVIYVGGDVLSRGLTLDGLQVSYFVRQPGSADTLLQMGRWFGYRPGYDDLVRIWMPSNVDEIFTNVATISQELREDLREMEAHGLTPKQFGLKIRLIPEIAIVAANKRRAAKVEEVVVNLHGQIKQSVNMSLDHLQGNSVAVGRLIERLVKSGSSFETSGQAFGWHQVPLAQIAEFFDGFSAHRSDLFFGTGPNLPKPQITKFLSDAKNTDAWRVVIVDGSGDPVSVDGLPKSFQSSVRNQIQLKNDAGSYLHFKNRQVASPSDLANTLPPRAHAELRDRVDRDYGRGKALDEILAKSSVTHPTLMLYAVTTKSGLRNAPPPLVDIEAAEPLWAVRVAFPQLDLDDIEDRVRQERGVKILVNTVWQEQFFGIDDDPEVFDEEVDG